MSGLTFDDLVAVAALGVSRKGFTAAELGGPAAGYAGVLDSGNPAAALLDAAALLTVARRAGVQPSRASSAPAGPRARAASGAAPAGTGERAKARASHGGTRDEPAGGAPVAALAGGGVAALAGGGGTAGAARERELSARGARLLARIGGLGRQHGFARNGGELLGDLLSAMRDAGYVLPAPLLPDLLDIASRSAALRPLIVPVLGSRGQWLAGHRPDWRQAAGVMPDTGTGMAAANRPGSCAAPGAAPAAAGIDAGTGGEPEAGGPKAGGPQAGGPQAGGPQAGGPQAGEPEAGGPEVWRVGTPGERRAYLAGLRGRDRRAGRELLAAGWPREARAERAGLLAALGGGLSADDEEFLEGVLGDRAGEVREAARALLARLPGSAFSRRGSERGAGALRLTGHGRTARLAAHVPDDVDKAALRDGIEPRSPVGWIDAGAWRLSQLIAAAPLAGWTAGFDLTPAQVVALPVEGAAAIDVRAGWRLAVTRQAAARQAAGQQAAARPATAGEDSAPSGTDTAADPDGATAAGYAGGRGKAVDPELAEWAFALLGADRGTVNRPPSAWVPDAVLAGLLPADLRAGRAAAMLADVSADARLPQVQPVRLELASHPVPWPPVLADAVLATLARAVPRPALTELTQAMLDTAGRGMPATGATDYAAELTRLADAMPRAWMPELHAAAETIALRRAFLAELR